MADVRYFLRFRTEKTKRDFINNIYAVVERYNFKYHAQAVEFVFAEFMMKNKIKGFVALSSRKNKELDHQIAHDVVSDSVRDMFEYSAWSDRLIIMLSHFDIELADIRRWIQKDLSKMAKTSRFNKHRFARLKRLSYDDLHRMRFLITELCRKENSNIKMLLGSNVMSYLRSNGKQKEETD